jgi:hypothetical protein
MTSKAVMNLSSALALAQNAFCNPFTFPMLVFLGNIVTFEMFAYVAFKDARSLSEDVGA